MKNSDRDSLWQDALDDSASDAFAEEALACTLANVRDVRRKRNAARVLGSGAILALIAPLAWDFTREPGANISALGTRPVGIPRELEPRTASAVRFLSDEELLARFPDYPVALVGTGHDVQLILLEGAGALDVPAN